MKLLRLVLVVSLLPIAFGLELQKAFQFHQNNYIQSSRQANTNVIATKFVQLRGSDASVASSMANQRRQSSPKSMKDITADLANHEGGSSVAKSNVTPIAQGTGKDQKHGKGHHRKCCSCSCFDRNDESMGRKGGGLEYDFRSGDGQYCHCSCSCTTKGSKGSKGSSDSDDATTVEPTANPYALPTPSPTISPTAPPTTGPTSSPFTLIPTASPTAVITELPTVIPTALPTTNPMMTVPTGNPTSSLPTVSPTTNPTAVSPTVNPTISQTVSPTTSPMTSPTTRSPTGSPTASPTQIPTGSSTALPTASPATNPTGEPTVSPTGSPTESPTTKPTVSLTAGPTTEPTISPAVVAFPTTIPTAPVVPVSECSTTFIPLDMKFSNGADSPPDDLLFRFAGLPDAVGPVTIQVAFRGSFNFPDLEFITLKDENDTEIGIARASAPGSNCSMVPHEVTLIDAIPQVKFNEQKNTDESFDITATFSNEVDSLCDHEDVAVTLVFNTTGECPSLCSVTIGPLDMVFTNLTSLPPDDILFEFAGLPDAVGPVTVEVAFRGDFRPEKESLILNDEDDVEIGIGRASPGEEACSIVPIQVTLIDAIAMVAFNNQKNDDSIFIITVVSSKAVDSVCFGEFGAGGTFNDVAITLSFQTIGQCQLLPVPTATPTSSPTLAPSISECSIAVGPLDIEFSNGPQSQADNLIFQFIDLPDAIGPVTVQAAFRGDFGNDPGEFITLMDEYDGRIGQLTSGTTGGNDCNIVPFEVNLVDAISHEEFNQQKNDGSFDITAVFSTEVQSICDGTLALGGSYEDVSLRLSFNTIGECPVPQCAVAVGPIDLVFMIGGGIPSAEDIVFEFVRLPDALGPVTIQVNFRGDFNTIDEFITLKDERGAEIAKVLGQARPDCNRNPYEETFIEAIAPTVFNDQKNDDGIFSLTAEFSPDINRGCLVSDVAITLIFDATRECPRPTCVIPVPTLPDYYEDRIFADECIDGGSQIEANNTRFLITRNVTCTGSGSFFLKIVGNDNTVDCGGMFTVQNTGDFEVGFVFDGVNNHIQNCPGISGFADGIQARPFSILYVSKVTVSDCGNNGLVLNGAQGYVVDSEFRRNGENGILAVGRISRNESFRLLLKRSIVTDGSGDGVDTRGFGEACLEDNFISRNAVANIEIDAIDGAPNVTMADIDYCDSVSNDDIRDDTGGITTILGNVRCESICGDDFIIQDCESVLNATEYGCDPCAPVCDILEPAFPEVYENTFDVTECGNGDQTIQANNSLIQVTTTISCTGSGSFFLKITGDGNTIDCLGVNSVQNDGNFEVGFEFDGVDNAIRNCPSVSNFTNHGLKANRGSILFVSQVTVTQSRNGLFLDGSEGFVVDSQFRMCEGTGIFAIGFDFSVSPDAPFGLVLKGSIIADNGGNGVSFEGLGMACLETNFISRNDNANVEIEARSPADAPRVTMADIIACDNNNDNVDIRDNTGGLTTVLGGVRCGLVCEDVSVTGCPSQLSAASYGCDPCP